MPTPETAVIYDDLVLSESEKLGIAPATLAPLHARYGALARRMSVPFIALAIDHGDYDPESDSLFKQIIERCERNNNLINARLIELWFPRCDTIERFTFFLKALPEDRRSMKAHYSSQWIKAHLPSLSLEELTRLSREIPVGVEEEHALMNRIYALAGLEDRSA